MTTVQCAFCRPLGNSWRFASAHFRLIMFHNQVWWYRRCCFFFLAKYLLHRSFEDHSLLCSPLPAFLRQSKSSSAFSCWFWDLVNSVHHCSTPEDRWMAMVEITRMLTVDFSTAYSEFERFVHIHVLFWEKVMDFLIVLINIYYLEEFDVQRENRWRRSHRSENDLRRANPCPFGDSSILARNRMGWEEPLDCLWKWSVLTQSARVMHCENALATVAASTVVPEMEDTNKATKGRTWKISMRSTREKYNFEGVTIAKRKKKKRLNHFSFGSCSWRGVHRNHRWHCRYVQRF